MEMFYMICAAIGGTLIVCQFLATLLGLGGHHDLAGHDGGGHDFVGHEAGGHDGTGHHEAGHEYATNWFFSQLTFRTLTAAFAFFGLAGLACLRFETEPIIGLAVAIAAGAVAFFVVAWLMQFLTRLNVDGTIRIERAVGARGTVYLSIPGNRSGVGKVHVNQLNRSVEYKAVTSMDPIPTGVKIIVVSVVNADTLEVERQEADEGSHESGNRSQETGMRSQESGGAK